jgi:hypothetical protein
LGFNTCRRERKEAGTEKGRSWTIIVPKKDSGNALQSSGAGRALHSCPKLGQVLNKGCPFPKKTDNYQQLGRFFITDRRS